jgi:hypothetical protein
MADRYWVGGTGTWTDTAKWAETSGGAGGFSVPTSSDDVFIDANSHSGSGFTITNSTNRCTTRNLDINAGVSVSFSFSGGDQGFRIHGNAYLNQIVTAFSFGPDYSFQFVSTGSNTVEIVNPPANRLGAVSFSGGGSFSLAGTIAAGNNRTISVSGSGTTVNCGSASLSAAVGISFGSGTTANLDSSTLTIYGAANQGNATFSVDSACTFNAGTSTLSFAGADRPNLILNGKSLYNLNLDGTLGRYLVIDTSGSVTNGLNVDCTSGSKLLFINTNNFTISGAITVTNSLPGSRVFRIRSDNFAANATTYRRTLTVNTAAHSIVDTYFENIIINGTAAPLSGTRLGNLGNVSGVTFSTPKTVYRIGTGNWNANQWSDSSGGSPNTDFFPLPQDTAVYDENTTAGTQNVNFAFTSAIDASARTTALTLTFATTAIYGNLTLGSGITAGGSGTLTFSGNNNLDLDSAGKTLPVSITTNLFGGTLTLTSALTITGGVTFTSGTFDTDSYALTATALNTSGNFPRSIAAGSSTITLSGNPAVNFTGTINFTPNFGTSTLVLSSGVTNLAGGDVTFYNVSFTSTSQNELAIAGNNTFNTLLFTASTYNSNKAEQRFFVNGNQTIATLASSGTAGNNRIFLLSGTPGTQRTLNIGSITASDIDFRDIAVTGSAAGSTPTRAGDCGNNSGIVFPAPKTVYWNLAGTQNWDDNGWAATSGGSPSTDNFPLAQDTAVFDNTGAADTVTLGGGAANVGKQPIGNVDMSARTTAMTLGTSNNFLACYGNWTWGTGVTSTVSTAGITFLKRGTQTFTSNGVTTGFNITIDSGFNDIPNSTIFVLGDAFSGQLASLQRGTFDAVSYNVTVIGMSSSEGSLQIRVLKMGSGQWTLTGTGNIWGFQTSTGIGIVGENAEVLLSNNSATARSFAGFGVAYKKLTIGGTSSTSTTTISGSSYFGELASTKTVAHTILFDNGSTNRIGVWSVTGTSGNVVTVNRVSSGVWNLELYRRTSGIDYLNVSNCTVSTASPAEFYVGANATDGGGNTRAVFTATPAARTLYWVGGTGNWSDSARWSLSSGGGGGEAQPTSFDDVIFDNLSNATGYTMTIDSALGARVQKLTMGAPATGNITWAGGQPMYVHDDISLTGGANITRTFTGALNLNGYTTGHTFDSNGVTFASVLNVNTFTGEWSFSSAYTNTNSISVILGAIDFDTYNVTTDLISATTAYTKKTIDFGSGTITLPGGTPINFSNTILTSLPLTVVSGTATISITSSGNTTFNGNGKTFYNVTFATASSSRSDIINGQNQTISYQTGNTFNNLTYRTINGDGVNTLNINNNTTINGTLTASGASGIRRTVLQSGTFGAQRTITLNALAGSSQDINFRDISIAGTASPISGTRFGDMGGNGGITMSAPKNVYRLGTGNWLTNNWAPSSGGSANTDNFPLPQDTAIFDEGTTAGTHNINYTTAISAIDASARTSALTLTFNAGNTVYGGIILGSGITVSGTSGQTFSNRSTVIFDSAGKTITFPMTITSITGTLQFTSAYTSSSSITLTLGILDLNDYNVTSTVFSSSNSNVRTIDFGSSVFSLSGTGTIWDIATSTNFTVIKGTGEILLTNTTTTARTFTGSAAGITLQYPKLTIGGATGVSTLTINGNNSFASMASTKTVAHTISIGSSTQNVGTWSISGTSGNVVTISGSSDSALGILITTATSPIQNLDYLTFNFVGAFPVLDTWYVGANSTNGGSLGTLFEAAPAPPPVLSAGQMFLLFM